MIVAFFDFDGTITKRDTFLDFVSFSMGRMTMVKGILFHFFSALGYQLKIVSGHKIKEQLLSYYFKNKSSHEFQKLGEEYAQHRLSEIIYPKALDKINWHKNQGHKVVVVTASIAQWVEPWCNQHNLELIATEVAIEDGILTGKLKGKNCIGIEKVNRIYEAYDVQYITYSYGYGNSSGDRELLAMVNEKYYKLF